MTRLRTYDTRPFGWRSEKRELIPSLILFQFLGNDLERQNFRQLRSIRNHCGGNDYTVVSKFLHDVWEYGNLYFNSPSHYLTREIYEFEIEYTAGTGVMKIILHFKTGIMFDSSKPIPGRIDWAIPPWVSTWLRNQSEFTIDDLDKLCGQDYDVGASRFGFNRKNKKTKARLDPTFGPVLLKHGMELEDWAEGFDAFGYTEVKDMGCNEFERELLIATYDEVMSNFFGTSYREMIIPADKK